MFRLITEPAQSNIVTGTLADLPRSRSELLAENALLRQQLIVLHRQVKTLRLTWRERLSLLFLGHWVPNWKQVLQIIKPDSLLRWHREGFRLFWRFKSRAQSPSNHLGADTISLIQRMARENPLWGSERNPRRVVEVGHQSGETNHPEVHARHALATTVGAILVDILEDAWPGYLGV